MKEEVKIPKGVREGQKLRFTNKGHASEVYNAQPGDLVGTITIKEHEVFKRKGYDIITEVPVTISQAILGSKIKVETIHGEQEIVIEKGVTNNVRYVIKNQGAPHLYPDDDKFGDHIVKFKIVIPTDLSEKQVELVQSLKEIEEALGIRSGDMDKVPELNSKELEYKIIGDKGKRFWQRKEEYKPGEMPESKQSRFFKMFKGMIF